MRDNDGLGSDNMTILIVDLLNNNGGSNGKATKQAKKVTNSLGGMKEPKAAGLPSKQLGTKMRK